MPLDEELMELELDRTREIDPNGPVALVQKGLLYSALLKHSDARRCFDTIIQLNPSVPDAWYCKGILSIDESFEYRRYQSSLSRERLEEAISCFEKALELSKKHIAMYTLSNRINNTLINEIANLWNYIGVCYFELGYYSKSLECFQSSLAADSEFALSLHNKEKVLQKI
jgi:tetratricopeptide (TPR) repeat protein